MLVSAMMVAAVVAADDATVQRFSGHEVVEGVVANDATLALLADPTVDIWAPDSGELKVNGTVHVRLPPRAESEHARVLRDALERAAFRYTTRIADVQALIDEHAAHSAAAASAADDFFDDYRSYEEVVAFTLALSEQYNEFTTYDPKIGTSVEGRDIVALIVHKGGPLSESSRPAIHFNGGQHAREWISPATVCWIIQQLLASTDEAVQQALSQVDVLFVPIMNPDGYTYSRTNNRMWRKNRRNNGGSYGVDLNRNWGYKWNMGGSSSNPASDTYMGPSAFSEPESTAVSEFMVKYGRGANGEQRTVVAIDYHSYSQLILRPWGFTRTVPDDEAEVAKLGNEVREAILSSDGKAYRNIPSWQLYGTSGTASDWYKGGEADVPVSYTIELRDTGRYGFLLPPSQIRPSGMENYDAFIVMLQYAANNPKQ